MLQSISADIKPCLGNLNTTTSTATTNLVDHGKNSKTLDINAIINHNNNNTNNNNNHNNNNNSTTTDHSFHQKINNNCSGGSINTGFKVEKSQTDTKNSKMASSVASDYGRQMETNNGGSGMKTENVSSNVSTPNSSDSGYSRLHDERYTQLTNATSRENTHPFSMDGAGEHRVALGDYDNNGQRPYDHTSLVTSTSFSRYDFNYNTTRAPSLYSYGQQGLDNHKLGGGMGGGDTTTSHELMKTDMDENSGPVYPRPIYHFDPTGPAGLPSGFSAINLSVKIASAQGAYRNASSPSPSVPVIDLSTSNIGTSNHYRKSPQPGGGPQLTTPSTQTLDLSLSRITHR